MAWGAASNVLAAGNDYRVVFYNDIGKKLQNFDFSNPKDLKYGILSNGKYFKQIDVTNVDYSDDKQEGYKKAFWEGK